jgi:uncharacterized membrane protein
MKFTRKLDQWRRAGLIDGDTVQRIEAYERDQSSPVVLYAVGGVGAVAIVLGIVAIVASNWAAIPAHAKLAVDGLVASVLAVAVLRTSSGWARDVLLMVNYGFVLASMSLIGQIYHLDSGTWRALLAWSAATLPMMSIATGRFAATLWALGLASTHLLGFVRFFEWLDESAIDQTTLVEFAVVLIGSSPIPYLLFARAGWTRRERPAVSGVFWAVGWLGFAALTLLSASIFYVEISGRETVIAGPLAMTVVLGVLAALLPRIDKALSARALIGLRVLLVGGAVTALFALGGGRDDWPVLAAVLQIFWLGWMAWTALQMGHESLFRLGVAAVCLRLLGVYVEVFGSMLETGFGLIIGGLLTMALTWFWLRKTRGLAEALVEPDSAASHVEGSP